MNLKIVEALYDVEINDEIDEMLVYENEVMDEMDEIDLI